MADILDHLACPECRASLSPAADLRPVGGGFDGAAGLRCTACAREFPIVDGVYVLWTDSLRRLQLAEVGADAPIEDRVRRANIETYDEVAEDYCEHTKSLATYLDHALFLRAIAVDRATRGPSGRPRILLDVGCGPGVGVEPGAHLFDLVVGVDISLNNLRAVRRRNCLAVLADAERLPFRVGAVDVITCFGAMHHFPDPDGFLRSCHAALRPGGCVVTAFDPSTTLLGSGPLARAAFDLRKPLYRWLSRFRPGFHLHSSEAVQERNDLAEHHRTAGGFTPEGLKHRLSSAGFEHVEVFLGVDSRHGDRWMVPDWRTGVLQLLSGRNPFDVRHWGTLTGLGRKAQLA